MSHTQSLFWTLWIQNKQEAAHGLGSHVYIGLPWFLVLHLCNSVSSPLVPVTLKLTHCTHGESTSCCWDKTPEGIRLEEEKFALDHVSRSFSMMDNSCLPHSGLEAERQRGRGQRPNIPFKLTPMTWLPPTGPPLLKFPSPPDSAMG
jgi:hypothetical protein